MIVFGLGNPGKNYEHTLHNAGFEATDRMAAFFGEKPHKRCLRRYREAVIRISSRKDSIKVVQPLTFMNKSGDVIRYFKGEEPLFVVCDNMDLPLGSIRIKPVLRPNTQKGLKSVQLAAPDARIIGIFIGIGRPAEGQSVPDYVLSRPEGENGALFEKGAEMAADALVKLAQGRELEEVQLEYNRKTTR